MPPIKESNNESRWLIFDQLEAGFNQFVNGVTEVIETVGNQINDFVENRSKKQEGAISLLKNSETTLVPQEVFKVIISFSEPGILHTTLLVCRSWAKDSFKFMKEIEVAKISAWASVMPEKTASLLPAQAKKLEGEPNVKELMQCNEHFIRAELKKYSAKELIAIKGKAIECQLGMRAYELITMALIEQYESERDSKSCEFARRAQIFYETGIEFQSLLSMGALSGASEIFNHLTSKHTEHSLWWDALVGQVLHYCGEIKGVEAKVEFLNKFNLRRDENFQSLYEVLINFSAHAVIVEHALRHNCPDQAAIAILRKIRQYSKVDGYYDGAEEVKAFNMMQIMVESLEARGKLQSLIWQLPEHIQKKIQFKK